MHHVITISAKIMEDLKLDFNIGSRFEASHEDQVIKLRLKHPPASIYVDIMFDNQTHLHLIHRYSFQGGETCKACRNN